MKAKFFKVVLGIFILANLGMAEYVKKNNEIYYKYSKEDDTGFKVENVDLNTFKILNDKYAKDSKSVYFLGNKSFEVYCGTKEVKGADVESFAAFTIDGEDIIKDENKIYKYTDSCEQ